MPNAKLENILPVLENGVGPVIRAALPFAGFPLMEGVTVLMIYPMVNRPENNGKSLITGMVVGGLALIITTALCLLVLGYDQTARLTFPSYGLAHVFGLREYRFLLLPLSMCNIVFALVLIPTTSTLYELIPVWGTYAPFFRDSLSPIFADHSRVPQKNRAVEWTEVGIL
ncbi:GerAB/ArcD/ProY family transporter [Brevibacillus centrosporus]|nr:GerAB/ArcD/ProY family transporter [Brevibacillus centrosporus]MEC2128035.1 GerAB/ArcD/ProY family transporter [Brevibacillus centrosporus]